MNNQFFCAKGNGKLHYGHTILTGFGFMASSIAWAIYDPYITRILEKLLTDNRDKLDNVADILRSFEPNIGVVNLQFFHNGVDFRLIHCRIGTEKCCRCDAAH